MSISRREYYSPRPEEGEGRERERGGEALPSLDLRSRSKSPPDKKTPQRDSGHHQELYPDQADPYPVEELILMASEYAGNVQHGNVVRQPDEYQDHEGRI